jgi:signal transduction histidine kinase
LTTDATFSTANFRSRSASNLHTVDLVEVCRDVLEEALREHPERPIHFGLPEHLPGSWRRPPLVHAFRTLLAAALTRGDPESVIRFLLWGEVGTARVTLEFWRLAGDQDALAFEPFGQARPGEPMHRLGLYLARRTFETSGGSVRLYADGERTTFEVCLPRNDR